MQILQNMQWPQLHLYAFICKNMQVMCMKFICKKCTNIHPPKFAQLRISGTVTRTRSWLGLASQYRSSGIIKSESERLPGPGWPTRNSAIHDMPRDRTEARTGPGPASEPTRPGEAATAAATHCDFQAGPRAGPALSPAAEPARPAELRILSPIHVQSHWHWHSESLACWAWVSMACLKPHWDAAPWHTGPGPVSLGLGLADWGHRILIQTAWVHWQPQDSFYCRVRQVVPLRPLPAWVALWHGGHGPVLPFGVPRDSRPVSEARPGMAAWVIQATKSPSERCSFVAREFSSFVRLSIGLGRVRREWRFLFCRSVLDSYQYKK